MNREAAGGSFSSTAVDEIADLSPLWDGEVLPLPAR